MGADIKLLRFDWEPDAGAAFYQLKFRPRSNSAYQLVGQRIPASVTQTEQAIPVHLQDWSGMRFIVAACNSAGCTNSAALNPRSLMLETIGYLKASNTDPDDSFGRSVVLSDDGYTLAVTAWLSPATPAESTAIRATTARSTPARYTYFAAAATAGTRRPISRRARMCHSSFSAPTWFTPGAEWP